MHLTQGINRLHRIQHRRINRNNILGRIDRCDLINRIVHNALIGIEEAYRAEVGNLIDPINDKWNDRLGFNPILCLFFFHYRERRIVKNGIVWNRNNLKVDAGDTASIRYATIILGLVDKRASSPKTGSLAV